MRQITNAFLWLLGTVAAIVALARPGWLDTRPANARPVSGVGPASDRKATEHQAPPEDDPISTRVLTRTAPTRAYFTRLGDEIRADNVTLVSGSMAYYGMLALFPALIAAVSIYGLVFDPEDLASQLEDLAEILPGPAADLVIDQLVTISDASTTGLRLGAIVAIMIALYTASAGMRALIKGMNIAYDVVEDRSWARVRILAYAMTGGTILAFVSALTIIIFLPGWLGSAGIGNGGGLAGILAIPLAFLVVVVGLSFLYRVAPSRHPRYAGWASAGSLVAAGVWVLATVGLSIYLSNFGNLNATYGTLTGVIVLLLWFFLSGFAVLLGAEVNALAEEGRRASSRG